MASTNWCYVFHVWKTCCDRRRADEGWDAKTRELQNPQGKALTYKPDKRMFEFGEGEFLCDESIYQRVEKASYFLSDQVISVPLTLLTYRSDLLRLQRNDFEYTLVYFIGKLAQINDFIVVERLSP